MADWLLARCKQNMDGISYWVVNGRVDDDPYRIEGIDTPEALMERAGGVYVSTNRTGTTIRWALFSSNWSSLYYLMETLESLPAPYTFEFYLAGWFSQSTRDPVIARDRMHELIVKSDIHLRQKTFVKAMQPEMASWIPDLLSDVYKNRASRPEVAVDCVLEPSINRFVVQRVGEASGIAKLFGNQTTTFPCLSGHSYDHIVSRAYKQVMLSGEAHYDHVIASLPMNNTNRWLTYQRVVLPHKFPDGRQGVSVVSEFGDVDISVL